ncbi:GAF domain-containing protein [Rheinheimera mesophila]|uniref:GAF domain-containing protein n=1 Tax=Rheinheimera mesophila TaxID=1547515 RepID=A0A3P3QK05_9GAMM|nr:HD family phosphohydrolase [Rheinheimera mesophila]KKK99950.1 phosphohydrolase [Rheinheimera mesophila]RRJ21408.1 GAF domain-containing protein [Rheinheimera mesophila]
MTEPSVLQHLIDISISLSVERNTTRLLERILTSAQTLTQADGGTIYSVTADKSLKFETLINNSLNLYMGGSSGEPIPFPAIPIYKEGQVNQHAIVAIAAAEGDMIHIPDVYACQQYDLSAARSMDLRTGYRTQSVLTVPMKNHEGELNGVLQLINATVDGKVSAFPAQQMELVRSLASLAAVALTNKQLIENMEELFQGIARLIAKAIDEKSPYTGGHCKRVPELTMMLADAVHSHNSGPLADFKLTEADRHELSVAGWLHDCGKIATPEYVMDKASKLQTIFDRIELVDAKIEIARRDLELRFAGPLYLASHQQDQAQVNLLQQQLAEGLAALDAGREFLRKANIGGEFMDKTDQQKVADFGRQTQICIAGTAQNLLSDNEIYNLSIARGTLTPEERQIINRHMDVTVDMLESLPFPKHLQRVPEFACGHHEKMDGTGYPKGLTKDQMSIPARMMAIADIFEALTASDRPYKEGKPLSECLAIMGRMKENQHIDPDLFDIFIERKVYLQYAEQFLKPGQIDKIDHSRIPGYLPPEQRYAMK